MTQDFKDTELGSIPNDWIFGELSNYSEKPQYGFTDSSSSTGNAKFLRITDITENGVNWNNVPFCNCPDVEKFQLKDGDIVFARIGATTGKSYLIIKPPKAVFASYLIRVRTKKGLLPSFLNYYFNSSLYWRQIDSQKGNNLKGGVNASILSQLKILIPGFDEQKKIALVLGAVENAIQIQEKLVRATSEIKRALMQKLFTEGTKGEKQKQTEIGLVPESWELVELGSCILSSRYGLSSKGQESGKVPILRMTNQVDGFISDKNLQFVDISDQEIARFKLDKDDVIFNRTNSFELVGRTAIFKLEGIFVFASYLIRIKVDKQKLLPDYLNVYLNSDSTQLRLKSIATRGVSQSNISATRLAGFKIQLPPIEEQNAIVENWHVLNNKILFHQNKKQTLSDLFKTLLHELMTGQRRVHEIDFATLEKEVAANG